MSARDERSINTAIEMTIAAPRMLVLWCPDWSIAAAGIDPETPAAVLHANRVVVCSAAARREGVQRGLRRREAQARCPELLIVDDDPGRDARAFESILASLDDISPFVEVVRPGLCAFAARGPSRYFRSEEAVALRVLAEVSLDDARIGLAEGRLAATLAARTADPVQRWHAVEPGTTAAFLAHFSVQVLDQPELTDILRRLGLRTLGDFAALPTASVAARFGADGVTAWRRARGEDEQPIRTFERSLDLAVAAELDPPAELAEQAAFVAKSLADDLHTELARHCLVCMRVAIEAETEHGEQLTRLWRHDGALTARAIAERVRWQLDGWLNSTDETHRPTAGISRLRLVPDELHPDGGRQPGLWGGTTQADERASRALARLQGMLDLDAVCVPVLQGGRSPAERVRLVPWGDDRRTDVDAALPWPGQLPSPSPALVHAEPLPVAVVDGDGHTVQVTGRGHCSAAPTTLLVGSTATGIAAWAGPWPLDERWWDLRAHRRRARFQLLTVDGGAYLAHVEGGRWWIEGTYD